MGTSAQKYLDAMVRALLVSLIYSYTKQVPCIYFALTFDVQISFSYLHSLDFVLGTFFFI